MFCGLISSIECESPHVSSTGTGVEILGMNSGDEDDGNPAPERAERDQSPQRSLFESNPAAGAPGGMSPSSPSTIPGSFDRGQTAASLGRDPQPAGAEPARPWPEDELEDAVESASPHVRFLLRELCEADGPRTSEQLRSRGIAFAITQRLCRARHYEELVKVEERGANKLYAIAPQYREQVKQWVENAKEPPPPEPKPRRRRVQAAPAAQTVSFAGTSTYGTAATMQRAPLQQGDERSLAIPDELPLEFCTQLIRFMERGGVSVRLILDGAGRRLELS